MKNKKADWGFAKIVTMVILLVLLIWVLLWYGGLGEEMIKMINSVFG